jgi:ribA/ribD-fused uncharacterized protein
MLDGLLKKFNYNRNAREKLLSTGDATVVYATQYDRVLGTGLHLEDEENLDQNKWEGLNELGDMLMTVRATLKASENV